MLFPKTRLAEDVGENCVRPFERTIQTGEEPLQPGGDIKIALLRFFQDLVVPVSLLTNLRRHAVEALRRILGACERHVGDGTRDAPVAVIEGMDGYEPQMR